MSATTRVKSFGRRDSPWLERLARLGLAAKGVSFGLVAVLAIEVAAGKRGSTADREGALRAVGEHPLGKVLLVALAAGFAGYAVWRIADAFLDRRDDGDDTGGLAKRASYLGRAAIYTVLFWTCLSVLRGAGGGSGGSAKDQQATAGVLGWPMGRWLVLAVGLAVAGAAVWNAYRGVTCKFEDKLRGGGKAPRRAARILGVAGHLARAVVFGIVAWFLVKAAVQYDAHEAVGLDGALARLVHQSYGRALLGVTAAGLLAYGVYCLFEARYREV